MVYDKVPLEQTQSVLLQELIRRVNDLEQNRRTIPVLDADPATTSNIRVWMLYDGRLRARNPNTGVVQEYTPTGSPGGVNSTVARPSPTGGRSSFINVWTATWSRTYLANGSQGSNSELLFGAPGGTVYRSLFGFNAASIRTSIPTTATVQRVELALGLNVADTYPIATAVGGHLALAEPASWSDLITSPTGPETLLLSAGPPQFVPVSNWWGTAIRDSRINAFGIDQALIGSRAAGSACAALDPNYPPRLRITYTL